MSERVTMPAVGIGRTVEMSFDEALERVEELLQAEGFGILTRIDVQATMKKKLDLDYPPFQILGACNPELAHKALSEEPSVSLMMPCNVVVRVTDEGRTRVDLVNPEAMTAPFPHADLSEMVNEAGARLGRVLEALG
jgi:uncharacterized protein (DUF302 family)